MPIKPENKARYPKDWKQITQAIRDRASNRCEGSPQFPNCRAPNGWFRNRRTDELTDDPMTVEAWSCADGDKVTRIVLTVAHLDHTPENCEPANLRAWCQRCHLMYDAKHHAINSAATRRKHKAARDMFDADREAVSDHFAGVGKMGGTP